MALVAWILSEHGLPIVVGMHHDSIEITDELVRIRGCEHFELRFGSDVARKAIDAFYERHRLSPTSPLSASQM